MKTISYTNTVGINISYVQSEWSTEGDVLWLKNMGCTNIVVGNYYA